MTGMELRWGADILSAFAPAVTAEGGPRTTKDHYLAALTALATGATPKAAWGLRLAIWTVTLCPPLLVRRFRLFGQLTPGAAAAVLERLLAHRWFALRELTLLLKFAAAMALLGDPAARAHSGYDAIELAEAEDTGVRRRLPVVASEDAPEARRRQEPGSS